MKKSHVTLALVLFIVLAGLAAGITAYIVSSGTGARAAGLPEAAAWMPASAGFLAYVDMASILASPLREDWERSQISHGLESAIAFRDATGMDPWTDFQTLAFSSTSSEEGRLWGLALTGDFDPERILARIEEQRKVERSSHRGSVLYTFENRPSSDGEAQSLTFPSSTTALFGSPDYVRTMLEVGSGRAPSAVDGALAAWLTELPLDATFWCVGTAADALHRFLRSRGTEANLPPLRSFAVSAHLDQDLSLIARGEAPDEESARKVGDMVRGLLALASLQQNERPELRAVLDSLQIESVGNRIGVSLDVPYETLRRLVAREGRQGPE